MKMIQKNILNGLFFIGLITSIFIATNSVHAQTPKQKRMVIKIEQQVSDIKKHILTIEHKRYSSRNLISDSLRDDIARLSDYGSIIDEVVESGNGTKFDKALAKVNRDIAHVSSSENVSKNFPKTFLSTEGDVRSLTQQGIDSIEKKANAKIEQVREIKKMIADLEKNPDKSHFIPADLKEAVETLAKNKLKLATAIYDKSVPEDLMDNIGAIHTELHQLTDSTDKGQLDRIHDELKTRGTDLKAQAESVKQGTTEVATNDDRAVNASRVDHTTRVDIHSGRDRTGSAYRDSEHRDASIAQGREEQPVGDHSVVDHPLRESEI